MGPTPWMLRSNVDMQVIYLDGNTLRQFRLYAIPEDKVRAMALVLCAEPSRGGRASRLGDGWRTEVRLNPGVFRGWGNKQLRLITGGEKIKVWRLPTRYDIHPQTPLLGCSSFAEG